MVNNKKTNVSINCYIWRKQTAEGGNNHTRFPLYSPPSADHKNNPNLAEIESNLLFHVLKCPFLKKPIPVYKLQLLASTTHTANCQHTAEHSGVRLGVEPHTGMHRVCKKERVKIGTFTPIHPLSLLLPSQPLSSKATGLTCHRAISCPCSDSHSSPETRAGTHFILMGRSHLEQLSRGSKPCLQELAKELTPLEPGARALSVRSLEAGCQAGQGALWKVQGVWAELHSHRRSALSTFSLSTSKMR